MRKKVLMNVLNPYAAGIDVGSKSYWVSIGQQENDVREFGVYSSNHQDLICWLKESGITTVAMESTGNYWQTLFSALQQAEFEVLLVHGRQIKNVKKEGSLKKFFDRIAYKKGRAAAVTATARKLAVIIWNMVVRQTPYKPIDENLYNERIRNAIIQNIKKKMNRMNLNINDLMNPQEIS